MTSISFGTVRDKLLLLQGLATCCPFAAAVSNFVIVVRGYTTGTNSATIRLLWLHGRHAAMVTYLGPRL